MNEENYQFLVRALGKLGFEGSLNDGLRTKMQLNFPSFDLKAKINHGKEDMIHELKFERKEEGGLYFLNAQNVTLVKETGEEVKQKFPIFNQKGFSAEETYNLMQGRSVRNKVIVDKNEIIRWTRIDFSSEKNKNDNFIFRSIKEEDLHFSLSKELSKLPIQNLSQDDKEAIMKGLQMGNQETVIIRHEGQRERVFLEASPGTNSITVLNAKNERLNLSNSKIQIIHEEKKNELPESTKKMMQQSSDLDLKKEPRKKIS